MASEEDIYIESDGKRVYYKTGQIDGTNIFTVPELSVVHRAQVACRKEGIAISIASGGISGNSVTWSAIDLTTPPLSGNYQSGGDISGEYLDIIAAGA